jgi:Fe-S-cluster containining protein
MPTLSVTTEPSGSADASKVPRALDPEGRPTPGDLGSNPRGAAFAYTCRQCSRCCYHKGIHVNPYEIARLARRLGRSTSEFRATWTQQGAGTTLRQTEGGACVFLGPEGCTVHSDRPLVCRLYPLGRHVLADGTEWFSRLEGHPQSEGEITEAGTLGEYLVAQGAAPFMAAADEYFFWLCAARESLELVATGPGWSPEQDAATAADLVDMDTAIARHCAAFGATEPDDVEDRKRLHLEILYLQIPDHIGGQT